MDTTMLDTPIWQLTPRQLFQLQEEYTRKAQPQATEVTPVKPWVTVEEASQQLGRSKATIYRYIKEGRIYSKEIGCVTFVNIQDAKERKYKELKRTFKTA